MRFLTRDGINIKHSWRNTLCSKTLGLALQGSAVKSKAMEETRELKKLRWGFFLPVGDNSEEEIQDSLSGGVSWPC